MPRKAPTDPPQLWALVVGISKYQQGGDLRSLGFAAKDAQAIYETLRIAGERYFPGRVHLSLLTTDSEKAEGQPTRTNLVAALKGFAKAKPGDVCLLYLAGHGVSYGGQDGDFYFLTRDAATGDLKIPRSDRPPRSPAKNWLNSSSPFPPANRSWCWIPALRGDWWRSYRRNGRSRAASFAPGTG